MNKTTQLLLTASVLTSLGCGSGNGSLGSEQAAVETTTEHKELQKPDFNRDSAYHFIAKQVEFGPRVPNTAGQEKCAQWLEQKLREYCDTVYVQKTQVLAGDKKTKLKCINLIGAIRPEAKRRILLLAHWDTRPWADHDLQNQDKPIDGADDGASGVGVLIEIAREVKSKELNNPEIGIDILLTDVEDYGKTEWGDDSYAIGTQYWARNTHIPGYRAQGAILLDMVGGKNARFPLEGNSTQYAGNLQKEVWAAANSAGFSSFFVYEQGGAITDDHMPINEILKIPAIDIIHLPAGSETGFPKHWHTHGDNMSVIDKNTLNAVGQTLLHYLYSQ